MKAATFGNKLGAPKHGAGHIRGVTPWCTCGLLLLIVALTSCSGSSRSCTLVGSVPGINISLAPAVAKQAASEAHLLVRWDQHRVETTAPLGPTSTAGTTSANVVPTGGLTGFAAIPNLPIKPVTVTVTVTASDGKPLIHDTLQITAEPTYPNGRSCPAGGAQGHLVVSESGKVRQSRS